MGRNALETLRARGFVEWCSDEAELGARFAGEMVTAYVGFDPSADSLHVGNMVPVMGLAWLQRLGHRPIALTGGGTGLIGDPSGKSKERQLLSVEQMEHNGACVSRQLAQFLDFDRSPNGAIALNNYDWLKQLGFIEFLRDTGKYFTVNYMIAKEFVRSRIEDPEKSISFTEMSYMLLQAYDFAHLFRSTGCRLQMGGNDQQGNITAGIDLIRKTEGESAYGLTFPLLLTASGQKFGKSEQGAVYLSPERTSPYRFHQFWINAEDADVRKLLGLFTFLDEEEIAQVMARHEAAPERRSAQRVLADDVTRRVHGDRVLERVTRAAEMLFSEALDLGRVDEETLSLLAREVPTGAYEGPLPAPLADLLVSAGACASKGEARRLIRGGGVLLNGRRVEEETLSVTGSDVLPGGWAFLRLGKKRHHLIGVNRGA